jgi:colanic acid biosynthesis glycosyl transferase WcaI
VFVDSVSKDEMPAAWSVCDLALVHLKNDPLFSKVIPSKIFEASGAGRAVLLALPEGEAADLVREYSMGEWVPPADPDALAERVAALADDRLSLARYARHSAAASVHFSRDALASTMLFEMRTLAGKPVPVPAAAAAGNVRAFPVPGAIQDGAAAMLVPDERRLDGVACER